MREKKSSIRLNYHDLIVVVCSVRLGLILTDARSLLWAEFRAAHIHKLKCEPPGPRNVTAFGDRVLEEVRELKMRSLGVGPCLI